MLRLKKDKYLLNINEKGLFLRSAQLIAEKSRSPLLLKGSEIVRLHVKGRQ